VLGVFVVGEVCGVGGVVLVVVEGELVGVVVVGVSFEL